MNIYLKRSVVVLQVLFTLIVFLVLRPLEWLVGAILRGLRGFAREFSKWEENPIPSKGEWSAVIEQVKEDWKG